ncbi:hypothetical protein [Metallosphaera hakonensis]|uniref:DUF4352 domain-containing protein n=1 Tax=Metallosphaera hakonensis JCM 8857 = DSM 7519 TaxID=1293036 RepID=A0A2U9IRI0_9CREN|nr:hypothetical protein [Metallosphaera hakonensis]AWR98577.1 hypothetical protein DFR87_01395 [Metallosphaera hakonensis JCM 8857 = DSM 7519]
MKLGKRYLKSKRAISGAVTALILVIVSVALALAVAVFAFGLFGSFGSSGNLQVVGTTHVYAYNLSTSTSKEKYVINITLTVKNPSSNPATINSVSVGNLTFTNFNVSGITKTPEIPAGASGQITINIDYNNYVPIAGLNPGNVGGTVPISLSITEGTLSPTITVTAVYEGNYSA